MSSNNENGLAVESVLNKPLFKFNNGNIPGVMGIVNHGNSCFANVIIQCMSNTEFLGEFFVSGCWRAELNAAQRAGRECPVTEHLALLIESLWLCTYDLSISQKFISVINRYSDIFAAEKQSDAHEFLLWLLNCVSDELNEVGESTAARSQVGKNQGAEVDDESRKVVNVKISQSDTSLISKVFQGQLHSLLTCPACGTGSEKVEPFVFLPLHIPETGIPKVSVFVTVVESCLRDGLWKKVVLRRLSLKAYETVKDLRILLAEGMDIKFNELVIISIDEHNGFGKTYLDSTALFEIGSELETLFAIHLFFVTTRPLDQPFFVIAVNSVDIDGKTVIFGSPVVIQVFVDMSVDELQATFMYAMETLLHERMLKQLVYEKPSEIFGMKIVDDRLNGEYIPDEGGHQPFNEDTNIISRFLTSMDGSPCYLRMILNWQESAFKRCVDQNAIKKAIVITEDPVSESKSETQGASLCDCLAFFTQSETLESGASWFCSKCKRHHSGAIKRLSLLTMPDVLIIQLKRFTQNDVDNSKLKILVDFPTTQLDLSRYVKRNPNNGDDYLYDLYAVCNHYGSMTCGHYTALCKNPVSCQWYRFDDDNVRPCDESDLVTEAAYLLFYQRRSRQLTSSNFSLCSWANAVCSADDSDSYNASSDEEDQISVPREASDSTADLRRVSDVVHRTAAVTAASAATSVSCHQSKTIASKVSPHRTTGASTTAADSYDGRATHKTSKVSPRAKRRAPLRSAAANETTDDVLASLTISKTHPRGNRSSRERMSTTKQSRDSCDEHSPKFSETEDKYANGSFADRKNYSSLQDETSLKSSRTVGRRDVSSTQRPRQSPLTTNPLSEGVRFLRRSVIESSTASAHPSQPSERWSENNSITSSPYHSEDVTLFEKAVFPRPLPTPAEPQDRRWRGK